MIRIGYAPGAYDLFHIGHLNLLRCAKERCDYLIAGVVSDDVLINHKGVTPVIPLAERLEPPPIQWTPVVGSTSQEVFDGKTSATSVHGRLQAASG